MNVKKDFSKTYHHGDLRRALLQAGIAILKNQGIESVTLRNVAKIAEVSHSAPYHYFPTKASLLASIAAHGFESMIDTIRSVAEQLDAEDPAGKLRAVGQGYLAFAIQNPELFRLMFRPELTNPDLHEHLKQAEQRTFETLIDAMQSYLVSKSDFQDDPLIVSGFAWSTVHGLATLHLDRVLRETPVGKLDLEKLAKAVVELIIRAVETPSMHA